MHKAFGYDATVGSLDDNVSIGPILTNQPLRMHPDALTPFVEGSPARDIFPWLPDLRSIKSLGGLGNASGTDG